MNELVAKALFRAWPFTFGHVRLMEWIDPPAVNAIEATTRLRRYRLAFSYDPNSYIGRFIHYRGLFEEQILRSIEHALLQGMTFIDVGANIGLHTVIAAHLVGPNGSVVSFEPGSGQRERLLKNISLNGLSNVVVYDVALGRQSCEARLYQVNQGNDGQSTLAPGRDALCPSEVVKVATLDSIMNGRDIGRGCVMKIDVEGSEMDVLEGGRSFIRDIKPLAIFVEVIDAYLCRFGFSSATVVRWLRAEGYSVKGLVRGRWKQIDEEKVRDLDLMATRL